jgi:hypothetical protein
MSHHYMIFMLNIIFITLHIILFLFMLNIHFHLFAHHSHSTRFGAKGDATQWSFFSWCQRRRSPVVFHFLMPNGTWPNGLSIHIAKGDATQWSFILLCQRERNPVVFHFTLPKGTQSSGLSFYFAKRDMLVLLTAFC